MEKILQFFGVITICGCLCAYFVYRAQVNGNETSVEIGAHVGEEVAVEMETKPNGNKFWFGISKDKDDATIATYGTTMNGKVTRRVWKNGKWRDAE